MNILAFVLVLLAMICFMADYARPGRALMLPGLACFAAGFMAQLVWQTAHQVVIH